MSNGFKLTGTSMAASALALAGLLGTANFANAEAAPGGENIDAHLGFTITTDYYFRSVAMENEGAIFQPEFEVGWTVWEGDVLGEEVALRPYLGAWMSLHDGGATSVAGGSSAIFQTNYILGGEIGLPYNFDLDLSYTFLTFPASTAAGTDIQEFGATLGYDAQDVLEMVGMDIDGLGLNLYKSVVAETVNSLSGPDRGVYGEFGIHASYDLDMLGEDMPVTASIGSTLGWSYKDYYQAPVNNRDWGFVSLDLGAEMPLTAIIPDEFGAWSVEAGLSFVWIGNAPSALSGPAFTNITSGSERFKALWHTTIGVDF